MTKKHKEILAKFQTIFLPSADIKQVWPKGKDAIRVRFKQTGLCDLIFTWYKSDDWKIETVKMFDKSVDGI